MSLNDLKAKKMLIKKYLVLILFFNLIANFSNGQNQVSLNSSIPPSPNAAEIGKYGTYPVGKVTGIPNISFNLYEINSGKIKLPIILSYHASGIKVNQRATDVGLGWCVMAGGTITRTVYDVPDDEVDGYFNYTPPTYQELQNLTTYEDLLPFTYNPGYDLEPDLFTYNIQGKSGKFICGEDKKFMTIPYDPVKISTSFDGQQRVVFKIISDDGTIYEFNDYTFTIPGDTYPANSPPNIRKTINSWYLTRIISYDHVDTLDIEYQSASCEGFVERDNYVIGKKLDGQGNEQSVIGPLQRSYTYVQYPELQISKISFKNGYITFQHNNNRLDVSSTTNKSLDEIDVFDNDDNLIKKINFNYDYFMSASASNYLDYRLKLTGFSESGTESSNDESHYFEYNSTTLPSIGSYDVDYWGYYNGQSNNSYLPRNTVRGSDLNNVYFNDGLSYNTGFSDANAWAIGDADREPSSSDMKAGILKKIVYPTGGYSSFEYEPNKYLSDNYLQQTIIKGGTTTGVNRFTKSEEIYSFSFPNDANSPITENTIANLHIYFSVTNMNNSVVDDPQTVTLTDLTTGSSTVWKHQGDITISQDINSTYQLNPAHNYKLDVIDYGDNTTYVTSTLTWKENTVHEVRIGGGLRISAINNYNADGTLLTSETYKYGDNEDGLGVKIFDERKFYKNYEDHVNEYFAPADHESVSACTAVSGGDLLQREYFGTSNYSALNYGGASVLYSMVTKYDGTPDSNTGKTIFKYNVKQDDTFVPSDFVNSGNYGDIDNAWNQGNLISEEVYRNDNGYYDPVSQTTYEYSQFDQQQVNATRLKQYKFPVKLSDCGMEDPMPVPPRPGVGHFTMFQYPIKTGASRQTKVTKVFYNSINSEVTKRVTTTKYLNPILLYPSEVSLNKSDGSEKTTKYYYPSDLSSGSLTDMYYQLTQRNVLNIPVKIELYQHEQLLKYFQTFYDDFNSNADLILPNITVLFDAGGNALKTLHFDQYDDGGNTLQRELDGNTIADIYSYNNTYPIAEAKNATQSEIAYSSFEADGSGNWSIPSGGISTTYAITGKQSYSLSNAGSTGISKSGLSTTQDYIVSYWTRNSSPYSISGTQGAAIKGKTVGGWTYYEHHISGVSSVSISGSGYIDELRLYPADAQMTTYTYEPLVGMTSQCGVDNQISYYEYDGLGRLEDIKDQDGNIIKSYNYHYQQ